MVVGGLKGACPAKTFPCPFLFFLSGTGEGDRHVSGPRLSLSSSEWRRYLSSTPLGSVKTRSNGGAGSRC
jgi:hypothetical protein